MKNEVPVITIDGPSGTGKGTVCQLLAKQLGWHMLDSGAIYRVLAWAAYIKKVDLADANTLAYLAGQLDVSFESDEANPLIYLNDKEVSADIRTPFCASMASKISVFPEVRQALLARQRAFAQAPGLVTDGRDMGTIVFPNASLKLFLDANVDERANRRYQQLINKGIDASLAQVVEELTNRDMRDRNREVAPLVAAKDAIVIDTTHKSIEQVMTDVLDLVKTRITHS